MYRLCFLAAALLALAATPARAQSITVGQAYYEPGETVTFTGDGFAADEAVNLQAVGNTNHSIVTHQVTAGPDGGIGGSFTLPPIYEAVYELTATGTVSGVSVQVQFDDDINRWDRIAPSTSASATPVGCGASVTVTAQSRGNGQTIAGGTPYAWTITGGSFGSSPTGTSNTTNGYASVVWTAPTTTGSYTAEINGGGKSTTFNFSVTCAASPQTITFAQPANKTFGEADFLVSATGGGSGNPVAFAGSGPCSVFDNGNSTATVSLTGAGSCSITATQGAGPGYTAATPVTRTFSIAKGTQTILFPQPANTTFGGSDVSLNATGGGSTSPVTFGFVSGPCTVLGSTASASGAGTCTVRASQAGDANYLAAAPVDRSFTIAPAAQAISFGALASATYGDAPFPVSATGGDSGSPVTFSAVGACTVAGSTVSITGAGLCTVTASQAGSANYAAATPVAQGFAIGQATLTGQFTAPNKEYDRTAAATVAGRQLDGVLFGDAVTLSGGTATFDDENVGTGKTVTGTGFVLAGAGAANYLLASATLTTTADITRRALTVTGATGGTRVYDGTTDATVTLSDNRLPGDDLTYAYAAAFSDKNVGTGKPISVSGIAVSGGADEGNYALATATASATGAITPLGVTGSFAAATKVYDGTPAATITDRSLSGAVAGDDVDLSGGSALFADANVGADKPVAGSGFGLSGADAGNYALGAVGATTADITPATIAGSSFAAGSKVYDGTPAATITGRTTGTGIIGTDDVALAGGTAAFADPNAGSGKAVSGTGFTLTGADAGNYQLAATDLEATADITPRPVTVAADVQAKIYGDPDPALTYQIAGGTLVGTDAFSGALTRAGGETVAGGPYAIQQGGLMLGDNYALAYVGAALSITPKAASVSPAAGQKVYGTPDPALTGALDGFLAGDGVSATYGRAPGADAGAYTIRAVLAPADVLGNYAVTYNTAVFTITKAMLTVTANSLSRTFGYANPTLTGEVSGFVNGDGPSAFTGGPAYATPATTASLPGPYPITVNVSGMSAANYDVSGVPGTLTVTAFLRSDFRPPINTNGARSAFKINSTVPAKFTLTNDAGATVPASVASATFSFVRVAPTVDPSNPFEDIPGEVPTSGGTFRFSDGQWIYNWGTRGLAQGTYRIQAVLNDGTTITEHVELRR